MQQASRLGMVIGVPSRGGVSIEWSAAVQGLLSQVPAGLKWQFFFTKPHEGKILPVEEAREMIAEFAVQERARHLLFIDDDTLPPPWAAAALWSARKPVVTGVTYSKSDPSFPMVFREDGAGPWAGLVDEPRGLYRVDGAGLSCCLIDVATLAKVPKPWFKWGTEKEADGAVMNLGEDTWFFNQLKKAGVEAWCDTRCLCRHADTVFTPEGATRTTFYPPDDVSRGWLPGPNPKTEVKA